MYTNEKLSEYLLHNGVLKTAAIINAFRAVDRADFLPQHLIGLAYKDMPLPIGYGATISQPYVVAFMLELLQPQPGAKILDIGSGSGWTTTLLAHIVSEKENPKSEARNPKQGKVFAVEHIIELKELGEANCAKYNFVKKGIAKFLCQDGREGLPSEEPFDAIQAAAAASQDIPSTWKDQLKIGGKIVAPIDNSIWEFTKTTIGFTEREHPGFAFVPLTKH